MARVIHLHPDAPPKPAVGEPCNGCGVCCAASPCPLGALVSRRLDGACSALQWVDGPQETAGAQADDTHTGDGADVGTATGRYQCGLVADSTAFLPRFAQPVAPLLSRFARRCISAGSGCDCDWEPDGEPDRELGGEPRAKAAQAPLKTGRAGQS